MKKEDSRKRTRCSCITGRRRLWGWTRNANGPCITRRMNPTNSLQTTAHPCTIVLTGDMWRSEFRPGRSLAMLALFRTFWRFSDQRREGTVGPDQMARCCRFGVWNARCGLQSLLDVNRLAHTRWWHTWKVMALQPKGGDTPMGDGGSWAPNVGYFTVTLHSDVLIGCAITTWLEPTFVLEDLVSRRLSPRGIELRSISVRTKIFGPWPIAV